jgi:Trk K+ transport system NAD-binding subunit
VLPLILWLAGIAAFLADCGTFFPWQANDNWQALRILADAGYRAAQLFTFEFDRGCAYAEAAGPLSGWLELARYMILAFVVAAVASFLVVRFRQWSPVLLHILFGHLFRKTSRRAVVLGYGPVGQVLARELAGARRSRFVTVIHKGVTPALREQARRDNIILLEGDPSDPAVYRRARPGLSRRVFVALDSDMRTLDAAVAAHGVREGGRPDIHVMLADPDLARSLPETAPAGFLTAPDIRVFALADEAARLLAADARFDRLALEGGQERVHLAILGCGSQGDAVAAETLLTAWRTGLGPPRLSIYDKAIDPVRARMRRRSPALFETGRRALHEDARVELAFGTVDLDTVDFGADAEIASLLREPAPVTAWVFAASDDSLNIRAASMLHQAMMRGHVPAAPIYVRIWQGHEGDTPVL